MLDSAAAQVGPGSAKELINPDTLAPPIGYSHGVLLKGPGRFLLLGGQAALDHEGKLHAPGDLVRQFDFTLSNIGQVLAQAGSSFADIVRVRIYVTDVEDYRNRLKEMGRVWQKHFGRYYPPVALVEVGRLFEPGAVVEVEAEAFLGGGA